QRLSPPHPEDNKRHKRSCNFWKRNNQHPLKNKLHLLNRLPNPDRLLLCQWIWQKPVPPHPLKSLIKRSLWPKKHKLSKIRFIKLKNRSIGLGPTIKG